MDFPRENKPTLLVLAAGMGSRYGGLKQLDPVGPSGETLLDYSVHDARQAGFDRVVFVVRRDIEKEFREKIGARYAGKITVDYVHQQLGDLPHGHMAPAERTKPWGTAHAIWCARHAITAPFAAINADDFYGADSFEKISAFLQKTTGHAHPATFAMVGYRLDKTLSEHGAVARGLCEVDGDGHLRRVEELTQIVRRTDGTIACGDRVLAGNELVSMNFWGFTPQVFTLLEKHLIRFLEEHANDSKAEQYIPTAVTDCIASGQATVRVLPTLSQWFGVTYRDDKPRVVASIAQLVEQGAYPQSL